ncbi:MAG: ribosome-associated translation inhibitor RaiA [Desulfobacteraceae bacterium]|nr:MAG: ribosome-associated translation inhibitor RaiA [Desulfobacteraceae bacterium]
MQTTVTFKKIDPSNSLKSYVDKKLKKFDKMLDNPAEASVVLSVEKIRHIAEITLTCGKLKIHAKEESESMYSSIDALIDKIHGQIKKNKEKVKRHMSGNKQSIKDDAMAFETGAPVDTFEDILVENIDYKPMDVEDAIIELNSQKLNFFVFNNARTEQVNVLYKHNNGRLGLIQPRG